MSTSLTVNGVAYAYPDTGDQSWGTAASAWAAAVTTGMLQKSGGTFTLTADVNFGATFGLIAPYFTSVTASAASTGAVRLANADAIKWRNNANGADVALAKNTSDQLTYAGTAVLSSAGVLLSTAMPTFTGDVTNSGLAMTVAKIQTTTVSGTSGSGNVAFTNSPTFTGTVTTAALSSTTGNFSSTVVAPSFATNAASVSSTGQVRFGSTQSVGWRNNADSGDVLLAKNTSDALSWNGTAFLSSSAVLLAAAFPALTGDITTSAGALATTMASTITGAKTFSTSLTSAAFISSGSNAASAGVVRLANTEAIKWRNNANGADVALTKDASDQLSWAGTSFLSSAGVLLAAGHGALTGDVTCSAGSYATTVAKIAGVTVSGTTGTTNAVFSNSPTLVTPNLGTPSTLVGTNITGTGASFTAGNVTTNANLTGPITSSGNATAIASQTGTGTTFVMSASPTLTGTAIVASITQSGQQAYTHVNDATATPINALTSSGRMFVRLTGMGSADGVLNGIAAGTDGQIITVMMVNGHNLTVNNASGSASAPNQILTNTGAAVVKGYSAMSFIYNGADAYWQMMD